MTQVHGCRPRLSICIPLYNKRSTLARTLESIERQNLDSLEVVIVDNASTDGSIDVVRNWPGKLTFKIHQLERTISLPDNWVHCLSLGTGDYLKLQLAGDTIPDNTLQQMIDVLDHDPSVGFVHGKTLTLINGKLEQNPWFDEGNRFRAAISHLDTPESKAEVVCRFKVRNDHFLDPVFIMRRELIDTVRIGIDQCGSACEASPDLEIWFRLFAAAKSVHIDKVVSHFYLGDHDGKHPDAIVRMFLLKQFQSLTILHLDPALKDIQKFYTYRYILWTILECARDILKLHGRLANHRAFYKRLRNRLRNLRGYFKRKVAA